MDLASGYWRIMLRKQDRPKTTFNTHLGLFQFLRLPFGLKTASSTFQRILNKIFSDFLCNFLVIYVDDVISWSNSQDEALKHHELIFKRAVDHGVQFKPGKCSFFSQSLEILGHHVTDKGRTPNTKGIDAILKMPTPRSPTDVKRFLGLAGYFRDYIPQMAERTKFPRKDVRFVWEPDHEKEFNDLKSAIVSPNAMLYHPDWQRPFEVHTDASKRGVGAMLAQELEGKLRPVRFASRAFSDTES